MCEVSWLHYRTGECGHAGVCIFKGRLVLIQVATVLFGHTLGTTPITPTCRCFSSYARCVDASVVESTAGASSSSSSSSSSVLDLIFTATDCQVSGPAEKKWGGGLAAPPRVFIYPRGIRLSHADAREHVLRRRHAAGGPRAVLTDAGPDRPVSGERARGLNGCVAGAIRGPRGLSFRSICVIQKYDNNAHASPLPRISHLLLGTPGDACPWRPGGET